MTTRVASHAGSWYSNNASKLAQDLDTWLDNVDLVVEGRNIEQPTGARVIIAPHAGYSYSGPAAAWAYKCLDLSKTQRIFLLGPSHHKHLAGCALSKHTNYATPLGSLPLDTHTIASLRSTGKFDDMSTSTDEAEHSLEMHLPYIYHLLTRTPSSTNLFPPLIPILVGNTSPATEKAFGALLAPFLSDPSNIFVISSDFCHWGTRFGYTYYLPSSAAAVADGRSLSKRDAPEDPLICDSIQRLDKSAMEAIESGSHDAFLENLRQTENTVCGRHPIGVIMAAIEVLHNEVKAEDKGEKDGRFRFVRYERSSEVTEASDSSVSYASAYAVL